VRALRGVSNRLLLVGAAVLAFSSPGRLFANVPTHCGAAANLAAADFNGDGSLDLVIADPAANSVSIYLRRPDGSFPKKATLSLPAGAKLSEASSSGYVAIATGDVNNDGKTDLLVISRVASQLSVFLGVGDGTFSAPRTAATPSLPNALAVADLNGDARADLVIVYQGTNKAGIWFGSGDGSFRRAGDYDAGALPSNVVIGDFGTSDTQATRDGKLDLAVTASGEDAITLLFGDGAGAFGSPARLPAPGVTAIAAADLNGDGIVDLVTANPSEHFLGVNVGVGRGSHGSFAGQSKAMKFDSGMQPVGVVAADFDADGKLDLAVAVQASVTKESGVYLLLNRPRPRMHTLFFDTPRFCATGGTPVAVLAGAFKRAGEGVDLAIGDRAAHQVSLLFGDGKGGLANCEAPAQIGGQKLSGPPLATQARSDSP
jgi:FG-GAP-like repeat